VEGWVNTGVYVLDWEVFQATDKTAVSKRSEYELTSSLQHLVDEGKEVKSAIIAREDWMDIGRPWDLLEANERALANLPHRVKGTVEQGAVLKGPIWLEENASIKSGSYLEGPVYIGKGSRIGPNARIRPSSCIEDDVVIGTSCEIKNSMIMSGTRIPHLSYVGDSIIGERCNLGAGTITANIRFDEDALKIRVKGRLQSTGRKKLGVIMGDGVQTGINATLMPGLRVGSNSWIGPARLCRKM
jgi:bifunctional UDP-N-acetylglucosamine pyrophosphorylase/glucosamine-1-phosphate N-acetyltransferase